MADINRAKILKSEREKLYIQNYGDRPNAMNSYQKTKMTAQDVKKIFDSQFDFLADKHNILLDEVIGSEGERQEKENIRTEAELQREIQEKIRALNEYGNTDYRWDVEQERIVDGKGEPIDESLIGGRFGNEISRIAAEEDRETAESERATAEEGRETAESERATAEEDRNEVMGNLVTALDEILFIQNSLINGESYTPLLEFMAGVGDVGGRTPTLVESVDEAKNDIVKLQDFLEYTHPETDDNIFLHCYPVDSIYMSVNSTSPAALFGGTWTRLTDKFLIGANNTSGTPTYNGEEEGGDATHTLTADEMPKHSHNINYSIASSHTQQAAGFLHNPETHSGFSGEGTYAVWSQSVGKGTPHNNMPPYLAVYMWQRTA